MSTNEETHEKTKEETTNDQTPGDTGADAAAAAASSSPDAAAASTATATATAAEAEASGAAAPPPADSVPSASSLRMSSLTRGVSSTHPDGPSGDSRSPSDDRPMEEIRIAHKRIHAVTQQEIEDMLHDKIAQTPAAAASSVSSLPARISSLCLESNHCSLLPSSTSRLTELNQIKIQQNQFDIFEQTEDQAPDRPDTRVARSSRGLRDLTQLHSLELIHSSAAPLCSSQLPASLTSLTISNWGITENFFRGDLSNLHTLTLTRIGSLRRIPEGISQLTKLNKLTITHNPHITTIPADILEMSALTTLDLQCNALYSLPESMDQLTSLTHLNVRSNMLIVLPRVFTVLKERGCDVQHDDMPVADGALSGRPSSGVIIEEIPPESDHQESSPTDLTPAASAAPPATTSHTMKRKKDATSDDVDNEQDARGSKHPRSSSDGVLHKTEDAASDDDDDADDGAAGSPHSDLAAAALAATSAPPRRAPGSKRKLVEEVLLLDSHLMPKKHKIDPAIAASFKYSNGELDYGDRITTGFIDAGRRSKLFQSVSDISLLTLDDIYRAQPNHNEREIVVVDEQRDVRLKQICKQARLMMKQAACTPAAPAASPRVPSAEELQLQVKLLACLVSDTFGGRVVVFAPSQVGGARSPSPVDLTSSAVQPGSPFSSLPERPPPLASLYALCHSEVQWWRTNTQSNVVLLCSIQHGLCRHRSILMKYLVDLLFHPSDVACKLVRGYREGGIGHAWTVVRIREAEEFIVDTLDSPHLFRPISAMVDPTLSYYPQWAIASSNAFIGANGESSDAIATVRDLHLARTRKLLGEGSYSRVYECFFPVDAATSQPAAVKISQIAHLTTPQFASLLKEIRILPYLHHPNLVSFIGYLISTSELKVFMELVRGCNLETMLQVLRSEGRRLTLEDILVITNEIAKGLNFLHQAAIIHRDIKSAQILIGHPDLCDASDIPTNFTMPLTTPTVVKEAHKKRTIIKVKRKNEAKQEESAAASAPPSSSTPPVAATQLSLAPRSPSALSFFSSAAIKLCDFNIAIPVLELRDESDGGDEYRVEYVGTLRWVAPEVFRMGAEGQTKRDNDQTPPPSKDEAARTNKPIEETVASSAVANVTPASLRLDAGKQADVWSFSNVLFELLTLHLPYESVPTEPELNEILIRGERTEYAMWLDPHYWPPAKGEGEPDKHQAALEEKAIDRWRDAVKHATAPTPEPPVSSTPTSSVAPFDSADSVYAALVGLFLVGTSSAPSARPMMDVICTTLSWLCAQRAHSRSSFESASCAATAPSVSVTPPRAAKKRIGQAEDQNTRASKTKRAETETETETEIEGKGEEGNEDEEHSVQLDSPAALLPLPPPVLDNSRS